MNSGGGKYTAAGREETKYKNVERAQKSDIDCPLFIKLANERRKKRKGRKKGVVGFNNKKSTSK